MKTFKRWKMCLISGVQVLRYYSCLMCNVAVFLGSTIYSSFLWIKKLKTKQTVVAKDQSSVVNLGFSVVTAHMNHLGVLINCNFLVCPGPRWSTANKLPGDGSEAVLGIAQFWIVAGTGLHTPLNFSTILNGSARVWPRETLDEPFPHHACD